MVREFDARLEKGDNPGAWTCVVMDDAAAAAERSGANELAEWLRGQTGRARAR